MEVRQGEVYWLDFGSRTGARPSDRHPCVVVQSDLFNKSRIATTVVCLITSNLRRAEAPGNVLLPKGAGGLSKESVVNVSQLLTVEKLELDQRLGRLTEEAIRAVLSGLYLLLSRRQGTAS